jgi:hypothetical protein
MKLCYNLKIKSNNNIMSQKESNIKPELSIKKIKKKKRCSFCKAKIGVLDSVKCRCDKSFCIKHLLPEYHNCSYDYKKDKIILEKVVHDKINKI